MTGVWPTLGVSAAGAIAAACFVACNTQTSQMQPAATEVPVETLADALVEVFCETAAECECADANRFPTPGACRDWAMELQASFELALEDSRLSYDPACVASLLIEYRDLGCDSGPDPYAVIDPQAIGTAKECKAPCAPIYGELVAGEVCTPLGALSSRCERGLYCNSGRCTPWCPPRVSEGDLCFANVDCGCELYCDYAQDHCRAFARLGEPCGGRDCIEGTLCRAVDPSDASSRVQCMAMPEVGEPCTGHDECTTGYCPAGSCAPLPGPGDSCLGTNGCHADAECIEEVCVGLPDLGEPCEAECRAELRCYDGVCLEPVAAICDGDPPLLRMD